MNAKWTTNAVTELKKMVSWKKRPIDKIALSWATLCHTDNLKEDNHPLPKVIKLKQDSLERWLGANGICKMFSFTN